MHNQKRKFVSWDPQVISFPNVYYNTVNSHSNAVYCNEILCSAQQQTAWHIIRGLELTPTCCPLTSMLFWGRGRGGGLKEKMTVTFQRNRNISGMSTNSSLHVGAIMMLLITCNWQFDTSGTNHYIINVQIEVHRCSVLFILTHCPLGNLDVILKLAIFNLNWPIGIWSPYDNALRWKSWNLANDMSRVVQIMAWYLSQYWWSSMSPYGVTRPQYIKMVCILFFFSSWIDSDQFHPYLSGLLH